MTYLQITSNVFDLSDEASYQNWRANKLRSCPPDAADLCIPIANPFHISTEEKRRLLNNCHTTNTAFYRFVGDTALTTPGSLLNFWGQIGLRAPDSNLCADTNSVSWIKAEPEARYIPYTDRPLQWHTDGCYNPPSKTIRSFAMHCLAPASSGGVNCFFDTDIMYILLRDKNPDYITALSRHDALTIPANVRGGKVLRQAVTAPVLDRENELSFRYSERTRNIRWQNDPLLEEALEFIGTALRQANEYKINYCLQVNEGVICNNVFHNRSAFTDDAEHPRLLYRARFQRRVGHHLSELQ